MTMSKDNSKKENPSKDSAKIDSFPDEGLIKTTDYPNQELTPSDKAQLKDRKSVV